LICDRVVGLSGSPLPASTSTFLPDSAVFSSTTVPHSTCAKWVHPLYGFAPLQSTSVPQSTPSPKTGSAFLGVAIPLRDINQAHRCSRLLNPPPSVLGVSHTLDGLIRPWSCGFISPHSHVQGSLFRGYSLRRSLVAFRQLVALSSLSAVRYWQLPTSSTSHRPALRALIRAGVRGLRTGG